MLRACFSMTFAGCVLVAGCGARAAESGPRDPSWPATPPTQTVACGAPFGTCPGSASLRIRWPEGTHAPLDAQIALDGQPVDAIEAELGVCAAPGTHALRIGGPLAETDGSVSHRYVALTVEVLAGVETRVALARAPVPSELAAEATLVPIDIGATVAALGDVVLPRIGTEASPEERRVFAPVLGDAFDAWRARLARVTALATTEGDVVLRAAATDHEARATAIRVTVAEDRPSADRLAAIQRAMRTEIDEAAAMIAIEHACPVYTHRDAAPPLAPVSIEARRYTGQATFVARLRIAIDDVEVLDSGWAETDAIFDATVSDGVVPPGDHVVLAEATFAGRPLGVSGGFARRIVVTRDARVTVAEEGTRVRVRALETGTTTTPVEERLVVEITSR